MLMNTRYAGLFRCMFAAVLLVIVLSITLPSAIVKTTIARSNQATSTTTPIWTTAITASAPPVEFVNSLGGDITTSVISGTLAFVGEGYTLAVLDISNPAAPVRRWRMPIPGLVD